jgi:hypothetical protein
MWLSRGCAPVCAVLGLAGLLGSACSSEEPPASHATANDADDTPLQPTEQSDAAPEVDQADAGAPEPVSPEPVPPDAGAPDALFPDAGAMPAPPSGPVRCEPADGTTGSPTTIAETVDLINGLPRPVTIACFLQSLDRPLKIIATNSVISAQPAHGVDSPRIFLLLPGLSLSVVPDGKSRDLLEFGELVGAKRSIKGELHFPIEDTLTYASPFEGILRTTGGTICATCHATEEAVPYHGVDFAYESVAYRISQNFEVAFAHVESQYASCDAAVQPVRCANLAALFDQGEVSRGDFPADMPVFF